MTEKEFNDTMAEMEAFNVMPSRLTTAERLAIAIEVGPPGFVPTDAQQEPESKVE